LQILNAVGKFTFRGVQKSGNNALHLCAKGRNDVDSLMFLIEVCKIDVFERNAAGETVLSICEDKGYSEGVKVLTKKCQSLDKSHAQAQDIFDELDDEERKKKRKV
jgi:hypothetical protein